MAFIGCNSNNVKYWSDKETNDWFTESKWSLEFNIRPDKSINKREFVVQNILNSEGWEAAFKFLSEQDLNVLEPGKYDIHDDGTFVNIEEYITKDSAHFEVHRKYIDIQCLVKGEEYIFVSPLEPEKQYEVQAYDEAKDIEFFDKEEYTPHLLNPENFMVFFPSDAHKPCMKVDRNEMVRKVVVKIPYKSE